MFGNSDTCTVMLSIVDTTKPTITCPSDRTALTEETSSVVSFSVTSADNSGTVTVVYSHEPDSFQFPANDGVCLLMPAFVVFAYGLINRDHGCYCYGDRWLWQQRVVQLWCEGVTDCAA